MLGIVAFFFLTDRPRDVAWWFVKQQQWITQKLEEEKPSKPTLVSVVQTLRSRTVLLLAGAAFFDYFAALRDYFLASHHSETTLGIFRHEGRNAGCDPVCCGVRRHAVLRMHSDRSCERRWHTAVPLFVTAAGLLGLIYLPGSTTGDGRTVHHGVRIHGISLSFWAIPTEILSESTAAFAVGMINALASVAGFAGPYAFGYLNTRTGSFSDWVHSADGVRIGQRDSYSAYSSAAPRALLKCSLHEPPRGLIPLTPPSEILSWRTQALTRSIRT